MSKTTRLTDEQLMALDTLIYHENLDGVVSIEGKETNQTVGEIVSELKTKKGSGAEMSQKEWNQMLDYIDKDKTLSSMKISSKTYKSEKDGFKAMLVTDPSGKANNTVILRGTASNYQWHDNISPSQGVGISPHQRKARNYVMSLGQTNLVVSGHSKGGNMTEAVGYLTPQGVIKEGVSFDGQGLSDAFFGSLTPQQKMYGRNKTNYINEHRDIVSKLFGANKDQSRSKYFKTNRDVVTSGLWHKPNLFMDSTGSYESKVTMDQMKYFVVGAVLTVLSDDASRGKTLADTIWPNGWSESYYHAVKRGNDVYLDHMESRMNLLAQKYASLVGKYGDQLAAQLMRLYNSNDSEVVEGAVISCDVGNTLGTLQLPEGHGRTTRGKNVLLATDTTPGENILFEEDAKCFALLMQALEDEAYNNDSPTIGLLQTLATPVLSLINKGINNSNLNRTKERMEALVEAAKDCIPDTDGNEWVVVDEDKLAEDISILLKKSVLYCNNGGVIEINFTGQI